MLDDDALQEGGGHTLVPHPARIHDDDRPTRADAEARRLPAFHARRPKEQVLARQQSGELRIQLPPPTVRRTVGPRAHEDMPAVRIERGVGQKGHLRKVLRTSSLDAPVHATDLRPNV